MRIAFDDQIFCMHPHGGVARYFVELAEQLAALQQEVAIFAPLHQNHYARKLPSGVVHGYALKRYPPRTVNVLRSINHVLATRAIKYWRPQIVHETYYSQSASAPRSCPAVVTVYDMIDELFRNGSPGHDNASKLKRTAVDRADHVICISENTRRDLMALFGTYDRKISVVHLACDRFFCNGELNEKLPGQTKPYLLYVGGRAGYKNYAGFLRAVASSKSLKKDYDIVAFGGGGFTVLEMALLTELGFQPDQVKHKAGDDILLGHLYDQAAALVYPSLYEGFGLPPLEAMAHQCAVVSSNTSSMPEVIGDAAEFFDPKSIDDMASAITRVVYSRSRKQELIERGRKRLELFSWKFCANQTLDIYRTLAD